MCARKRTESQVDHGKAKNVFACVLSILLALALLLAGVPKLLVISAWIEKFTHWGYPRWSLPLIGLLEVGGLFVVKSIIDSRAGFTTIRERPQT